MYVYVCVCCAFVGLDNKHLGLIIVKVGRFAVDLSQNLNFDFYNRLCSIIDIRR
jgi:hypothetical protein